MKKRTLSPGAKLQALLLAGEIRLRAHYSAGHKLGFKTEFKRTEMMEVADLLESAGQPHRGRRSDSAASRIALQLIGAGKTPSQAARYALAYRQWQFEFDGQTSLRLRKRLTEQLDEGLKARMRAVSAKDVQRLLQQVEELRATLTIK